MSIRCLTCGEFIYKGKKFNARKETVQNEEYLGIKIFRFYVKCTRCSSEITIKTDPKNSDYVCEMGATRNFEGWKEGEQKMEEFRKKREEEEEGNAMKVLENKTLDNKMEMDILDGLDEIRSLNARASKIDPMDILEQLQLEQGWEEDNVDKEEEDTIQKLMKQSEPTVRRLPDEAPVVKSSKPKSEAGPQFKPPPQRLPKKPTVHSSGLLSITATGLGNEKPVISLKFQPKFRSTLLVKKASPTQKKNPLGDSFSY